MLKEMNSMGNYLIANIDEPYAPEIFKIIKKGEKLKKGWDEPEEFNSWCTETFGGCFIPAVEVVGVNSHWLTLNRFYGGIAGRFEDWKKEIVNILFYELCGGEESQLSEYKLPNLKYIEHNMWKKCISMNHCEERILWGTKKNPIVKVTWEWVEKEDLDREFTGF